VSTFGELVRQRLPDPWAEAFGGLLGCDVAIHTGRWIGPPPQAWIRGEVCVGGRRSAVWIGTTRRLAFEIAARLTLSPLSQVETWLEGTPPPIVDDAFSEWGNLALGYLGDVLRRAFGQDASARAVAGHFGHGPEGGESLDFRMSLAGGGRGPVRLLFA